MSKHEIRSSQSITYQFHKHAKVTAHQMSTHLPDNAVYLVYQCSDNLCCLVEKYCHYEFLFPVVYMLFILTVLNGVSVL